MSLAYSRCLWLLFFIVSNAIASEVSNKVVLQAGNIYYSSAADHSEQLTFLGKDSSPVLSSNKKLIAFIREGKQVIPSGCEENVSNTRTYGKQVWIYDLEKKKERLLVANDFTCDKPEKKIVDPDNLQFSPDDKKIYFLTSAWTTSGALHVVNIDNSQQHYIIPANTLEVIKKGQYKGNLIVQQHRYFIGGGSFDWYWVFTPSGTEVGPIGEEISQSQREIIEAE